MPMARAVWRDDMSLILAMNGVIQPPSSEQLGASIKPGTYERTHEECW